VRPHGLKLLTAGLLLTLVATALFAAGRGRETQFCGLPLVLWLAGGGSYVVGSFLADRRPEEAASASPGRLRDPVLLVLVVVLALGARLVRITSIPNGCQVDEAAHGLFGEDLVRGAPYVPYIATYQGRTTLYDCLAGLTLRLLGHGVPQLRITSVALGSLTVAALFLLARPLTGSFLAFLVAALLAVSRWHVTFSRIAFETILDPLATVLVLVFLLRALREGRARDWALAGVALAVGLNGYMAFRAAALATLIFVAIELARRKRRSDVAGAALLLGGLLVAIAPLAVYAVQNPGVVTKRARLLSVWNDVRETGGSLRPLLDNLLKTLGSLHLRGDPSSLNNLPGAPLLDPVTGVLVLVGVAWALLSPREPVARLVLIFIAFVGSVDVLSNASEAPSARRILGLLPVLLLGAGVAVRTLSEKLPRRALTGLAGALAAGLAFAAFFNLDRYFRRQATAAWPAFTTDGSAPVGELLRSLPRGTAFYYSATFPTDEVVDFVSERRARAPLNLATAFPPAGDAVYVLPDGALATQLVRLCPSGRLEAHRDPWGAPMFFSFWADGGTAASCTPDLFRNGLLGSYVEGLEAGRPPAAVQRDALIYANDVLPAPFEITWKGALAAPLEGSYRFRLVADDGALLFLDAALIVDDGGFHAAESREGTAELKRGFHRIEIRYWQLEGARRLDLRWQPPGRPESPIPPRFLFPVEGAVPPGTPMPEL
jgi:hypothetical protein